jgi:hypothetical protein
MTIYIAAHSADAGRPEKQPWRRVASLAAFKFLRYATRSELIRFGALDDLRRH